MTGNNRYDSPRRSKRAPSVSTPKHGQKRDRSVATPTAPTSTRKSKRSKETREITPILPLVPPLVPVAPRQGHKRWNSSSSADSLGFSLPAVPTSTRQKPPLPPKGPKKSKKHATPNKSTPINKRKHQVVQSCVKPTYDPQSPFAGSFSLNNSFSGSAFTNWRTPSSKGMPLNHGAKTAAPRMQEVKKRKPKKDASVFSSDGEDEETSFWMSPPAKTPKKATESPQTPQGNMPADWWLLSPFKHKNDDLIKTPMRRLMHGMDKVTMSQRLPLASPSPKKSSISIGPTITGSKLNGEAKTSASVDPLRNFILKSPTRQIRSQHRPPGQATASAQQAAAETTAAVSTIGGRVNARSKGKELASKDGFQPVVKPLLFPDVHGVLPDVVLERIFELLPKEMLMTVAMVNKQFANVAVPMMWTQLSLRSTAGMWKLWSLMAGAEQVRSKSIPGNLPPLPSESDMETSPMRRSNRIIISTPPSKRQNPYGHHESTMILSPRLVHLPPPSSPYFSTLLSRSKSYRTYVESLNFRSIDADGKRAPMLRGSSLQVLKLFVSNRRWFPNLRELYLSGSAEWIDDELLEFISAGNEAVGGPLGGLRHLTLSGCRNISREALMGWIPRIKSLEKISIEYSEQVDDDVVETLVRNLPRLHSVRFPYCNNITDRGVRCISEISDRLKEIDLSFCSGVSRSGVSYLLHNAGRQLTHVEVGHIGTNTVSGQFGDVIPASVKVLDLGGHDPLPLIHHLPRHLEVLRLQDCQQLTMKDVRAILDRCVSLHTLDLSDCGQIDQQEVYELFELAKEELRKYPGMEERLRGIEQLKVVFG